MEPGNEIAARDELLELLYWFEGEGFKDAATSEAIARFLMWRRDQLGRALDNLVERGDVAFDQHTREYKLTEAGRREAARRFAEEFGPLLHQGHGECNDPDCECHTDPSAAAECHAARRDLSSQDSGR